MGPNERATAPWGTPCEVPFLVLLRQVSTGEHLPVVGTATSSPSFVGPERSTDRSELNRNK
jgi:hypothetical protein